MAEITHELRGIPLWLLRDYLIDLGGQAESGAQVSGPGWQAQLTGLDDFRLGSLRVAQVRLELRGDSDVLAQLEQRLRPKLLRAGG